MAKHKRFKTLFLSDIHLGSRGCKVKELLEFLKNYEAEKIYLVGDIIDGWRMRSRIYWTREYNNVIRKFLNLSRKGVEIIWITGNHDDFLRPFVENCLKFGNIKILNEDIYVSNNGMRFWIVHGDIFDGLIRNIRWLNYLGDTIYDFLLFVNTYFNNFRKILGLKYWSLSSFLKNKTKKAIQYINKYRKTLVKVSKNKNVEGIICGHIHYCDIKFISDVLYINCGDFVETISAVAETLEGNFVLFLYKEGNFEIIKTYNKKEDRII